MSIDSSSGSKSIEYNSSDRPLEFLASMKDSTHFQANLELNLLLELLIFVRIFKATS